MSRLDSVLKWAKGSLKSIFDEVADKRRADFVLAGMCLGINRHNEPFAYPAGWANDDERPKVIGNLRLNLACQEVTDYVIVSEAWTATSLPGETEDDHIPPSERADRREIVSLTGASRDGTRFMIFYPILRDAEGVPSLGELEEPEYTSLGRTLPSLFDDLPEPPAPLVRMLRNAKAKIEADLNKEPGNGGDEIVPVRINLADLFEEARPNPYPAGVFVDNPSTLMN